MKKNKEYQQDFFIQLMGDLKVKEDIHILFILQYLLLQ